MRHFLFGFPHFLTAHVPRTAILNIGFDFGVNIQVNDDECSFSAKEIRTKIRLALDKVVYHYGYDHAEDFTRVLTIKVKDKQNLKILHSCDFVIINDYIDDDGNGSQEYIHFI